MDYSASFVQTLISITITIHFSKSLLAFTRLHFRNLATHYKFFLYSINILRILGNFLQWPMHKRNSDQGTRESVIFFSSGVQGTGITVIETYGKFWPNNSFALPSLIIPRSASGSRCTYPDGKLAVSHDDVPRDVDHVQRYECNVLGVKRWLLREPARQHVLVPNRLYLKENTSLKCLSRINFTKFNGAYFRKRQNSSKFCHVGFKPFNVSSVVSRYRWNSKLRYFGFYPKWNDSFTELYWLNLVKL